MESKKTPEAAKEEWSELQIVELENEDLADVLGGSIAVNFQCGCV